MKSSYERSIALCDGRGRRLEEIARATLWTAWSGNTIPPTGYQSAVARGEPGALASLRMKSLRARGRGFKSHRPHHVLYPKLGLGHDVSYWNADAGIVSC